MSSLPFMFIVVKLILFSSQISSETDIITQFHSLHDGTTKTLVNGTFELGFFSPGSSTNRYVGIWFKNIPIKTVVWVANHDHPISDKSGILSINKEGNLVLLSKNGTIHWSTNITTKSSTSSFIARLLGTGNLVLNDEQENNGDDVYLWQSFDYPTDTILPGTKLGWNLTSGFNRRLTAWNNWDDPSSGQITYGFIRSDIPEMELWNSSSMLYRSGPFNGIHFSAAQKLKHAALFTVDFEYKKDEYYFSYHPEDPSLLSRIVINQTVSALQQLTWSEGNQRWMLYSNVPRDECDNYNRCSSFGICAMMGKSSMCECLTGFTPKLPQNWSVNDWSQGCVPSENWSCREKDKDGFIKVQNVKVPDTKKAWINRSLTLEKCKAKCWENCSCTAYANSNILGDGSGCILWFGNLLDLRQLPDSGQDLYVRFPALETANRNSSRKMVVGVTCTTSLIIVILLLFITLFCWRRKAKSKSREEKEIMKTKLKNSESEQENLELPFFDFGTIAFATDDFSDKLGEGGFGPVYRGTLQDGQNIAVKRLSHSSTQGTKEFKNEVIFCSKLQHRNLVKVLGFCIEEEEKLLIYEYMPNKSLDFFLFDSSRSKLLDWSKRFDIICGIARGLLYLHQDSRLRVIHRDLKASNILLDNDMSPKIADFGLARMCGGGQIQGNTSRVVGTYGYMAPEYAIDGIFSIKSDAWRLWKECNPMEFIDTCLEEGSYISSEVLRCIRIGLLCVQHHPNDRPTMTSVLVMLTSDSTLPHPKEPVFLAEKVSAGNESTSGHEMYNVTNEVSKSILEPR